MAGSSEAGDSSGFGDITLFGEYRLAKETASTPAWALLAGLKLPTGETGNHDDQGELFETEHQPGSGSIDPLLGVAVTKNFGRASLSGNVLYTKCTEGTQATTMGDIFAYNLAWGYRLGGPEPHPPGDAAAHPGR